MIRTGIDLGTSSVKLVRGEGDGKLKHVTHAGLVDLDGAGDKKNGEGAQGGGGAAHAAALKTLLGRLKLSKGALGRLAVGISGEEAVMREALLPQLNDLEMERALPYEAKNHLALETLQSPVIAFQILGNAPPAAEGEKERTRVLLAAIPQPQRDLAVRILGKVGLEPEVVDLEPLAGLNAIFGAGSSGGSASSRAAKPNGGSAPEGLLDLGAARAGLTIGCRDGKILTRFMALPVPWRDAGDALSSQIQMLVDWVRESLNFYRTRNSLEVQQVWIAGGGALLPRLSERLRQDIPARFEVFDPFTGLTRSATAEGATAEAAPRFTIASGLCRWWDDRVA